ncbi:MAG: hypothetical protein LUD22_04215 [Coprobacillus sp.]|nr:hypothetical protein [Coprobacillus sp.]
MKKKKLFVLLPLVALLLSSCGYSITPWDAPEDDEDEPLGEYTPSDEDEGTTQNASYSVSITNGEELSLLKEGESAVVNVLLSTTIEGEVSSQEADASDVTITSLNPDIVSVEGLRITALKEGYTSIYATWTKRGQNSVPVGILVQSEYSTPTEPDDQPDVIDYSVEITNTSEISSLVEGDSATLSVSLITTTNGVPESVSATASDVTLSSSDTNVVSVIGLTISALSKGTSNITATWTEQNVTSDPVTVSISEVPSTGGDTGTEPGEEPGDEPETPDPVISYRVEIANAEEIREIQTGDQRLVQVVAYQLSDGVETGVTYNGESSDETLTLISSDPDYLSVDGLTITALAAKEAITLTAVWTGYGVASAPITVTAAPEPEPEPDVYTYEMSVNNQEELLYLGVGYGYENGSSVDLDITLTTYINGEYAYSYKADNTVTDLEVISWDTSIVTTSGLTVTAVDEGSSVVEIKWSNHPLNGGGEGFSDLSYFVNVTVTRYEEPEPDVVYIEKIGFTQDSYSFELTEYPSPTQLQVCMYPAEPTSPTYTIFSDDESIAKVGEGNYLYPVGVGETDIHVVALDKEEDPAAGTAHVTVSYTGNPILSFGTSTTNIELSIGQSVTLGYENSECEISPDVEVYANPSDAENLAFTLTGDYDTEYLQISERSVDGYNTYTITALEGEGAGLTDHVYPLTISADSEYSDASTTVYVTILTDNAKANPVTSITLSEPYVTIANNGSFTLGNVGSDADVTVSVNEGAYEDGWNLVDYDASLLSVDFDYETGLLRVSATEPDITETTVTNIVLRTMGAPVKEARLAVYILRAEDYTASINVSTSSVDLLTDQTVVLGEGDYSDFSVNIYNQYGEVLEGASWSASIESSSGIGVLSSVERVEGSPDRLSISAGTNTGTGIIRISADDDESVYQDISVTVSQQYYDVERISCSLTSISLTYNEESSPKGSSAYIQDSAVTYWNSNGPVASENEGFELIYCGSYLEIGGDDNKTITALLPTGEDGVDVIVRSTSNTSVTTSINVVVNDLTDYGVKTLSLVDGSGNDVTSVDLAVSATEDSTTTTLAALGVYVNISPEYATNKDYTVSSSNPSLVYVDSNNNITAKASKDGGSATLFVIASDNTYGASDSLTVNVSTSYVKADSISVNYTNTDLTTGDTYDFDTEGVVSVSSTSGTPTDTTYTISSSNPEVISVNGHVITAESAGDATLTFTTVDGASTTVTITVTDPRTVGNNITLYFRLTGDSNAVYTCPEYADIWIGNNFADGSSDWTATQLTADSTTVGGSTYYKATFASVLLDTTLDYQILFEYTEDGVTSPTWNHKSTALTLSISGEVLDGGSAYYDAKIGDPTEIIHERNTELGQFTVTVGLKNSSSSGSNITFAIAGTALDEWSGGKTFIAASGNESYDQYYTFNWDRDADMRFFFGKYDVWWSWNVITPGTYSPTWGENAAYCWYNEWSAPEWAFDLTSYNGALDNYTNLLIVFTFDFSRCYTDDYSFAIVSNMSVTLS